MTTNTIRLFSPGTGTFDIFTSVPEGPNAATNLILINILIELRVANELAKADLINIIPDELRELRVDVAFEGTA